MPEGFDDHFILIDENGIGVLACEFELQGDDLVFVGAFGGQFQTQYPVIVRDCDLKQAACTYQGVQQFVKGGIVPLKRPLAGCFVDEAVPSGQIEEITFRGNRRFELKENEVAMLKMRNGALQIIMRSGSVGTVKNGRTLRFKEGELWAFAGKQAAGFTIQTPHSRVTITGTVFGIKTSPSMDEIVVLRGKLRAEVNKRVVLIEKGQSLRISYDENARETLSLSDHSAEPPEWAMELVRQYQKQYFYRYFPSAIESQL